ncbi:hypothetical protein [Psychrobacter sp. UBA3480]|uniref:hypothetical protein n=1 Tax=Psychrobacter sp. UBA3480 TaxID=1947350 RepID=UPI0025D3539C|nr:hypothetical protein [Psychrobacter sp. UBA3480]
MKYIETKLSYDEFITLLKSHTDYSEGYDSVGEFADRSETLDAGMEDYPTFYYFPDLAGKKYVLEENEGNGGSVVYEVIECDEESEYPCQIILRDTVGAWDGDANENIALYEISVKPYEADEFDTDVRVWIEFYYSDSTNGAPLDRYVKNNDINKEDSSFEAYKAHEFDTYADAQAWIDKQENSAYYLSNGEVDRPKYIITG